MRSRGPRPTRRSRTTAGRWTADGGGLSGGRPQVAPRFVIGARRAVRRYHERDRFPEAHISVAGDIPLSCETRSRRVPLGVAALAGLASVLVAGCGELLAPTVRDGVFLDPLPIEVEAVVLEAEPGFNDRMITLTVPVRVVNLGRETAWLVGCKGGPFEQDGSPVWALVPENRVAETTAAWGEDAGEGCDSLPLTPVHPGVPLVIRLEAFPIGTTAANWNTSFASRYRLALMTRSGLVWSQAVSIPLVE